MRPSTTERWVWRAAIGALLVVLACGDDDAPQVFNLLEHDFEERCDGMPCDWTRLEGEADQALYVETFHSGDHGIALVGDDVTVRGPGGESMSVSVSFGSIQAQMVAICDPGAELDVRIGLIQPAEAGAPPIVDTLEATFDPGPDWGQPERRALVARGALMDGGLGTGFVSGVFRITGVTISKRGAGRCVVSSLLIDDVLPRSDPAC